MADSEATVEKAPPAQGGDEPDCDLLPLGSVVRLRGAKAYAMIVARALQVNRGGSVLSMDYGACPWPLGLIGDQVIYCNADDIERVLVRGYEDDEERAMRAAIVRARAAQRAQSAAVAGSAHPVADRERGESPC